MLLSINYVNNDKAHFQAMLGNIVLNYVGSDIIDFGMCL